MSTEYEVSINCRNLANKDLLSKSDPVAILLQAVPQTKRFVELGRTELIKDCLNPRFVTRFRLTAKHGEDPELRVAVIDIDDFDDLDRLAEQDFIGRAEFHQSQLIANPIFSVPLSGNSGEVTLKTARYVESLDGHVTLELANHSFPLKGRPVFLEISRADEAGCADESAFTLACRTELSVTGDFQPIKASLFSMALGDRDRPLRFELWRHSHKGDHVRLGRCDAPLSELERLFVTESPGLLTFDYKGKNGGNRSLVVKYFDLRK